MGGWFNKGDGKPNVNLAETDGRKTEKGKERRTEGRESTASTTSTSSDSGEGRRTTGRTRGRKTEEKELSPVAVVEVPEVPKQGKPKTTRKPRKKKEEPKLIDQTSLNAVIGSISAVVASRPDCEHWMMTETEINSITTPLSKMIDESELFKDVGNYSNQIALVLACATVFTPRIIVSVQKVKEKKQREITGNSVETNVGTGKGNVKKKTYSKPSITDRTNQADTSTDDANIVTSQPWFGEALA